MDSWFVTLLAAVLGAAAASVPAVLSYRAQMRKTEPEGVAAWQELVASLRQENAALFEAQAELRTELAEYQAESASCKARITEQAEEIAALRGEVAQQRAIVARLVANGGKS